MRGEIAKVDMSIDEARADMLGRWVPKIALTPGIKRHVARQEMQAALRESIAWWGGYQRAAGRDDSESYKRFYWKFGIDVLSATALDTKEARDLAERINTELGKSVTLPEVNNDSEAVQIIKELPDIIKVSDVSKATGLTGRAVTTLLINNGFIKYKFIHLNDIRETIYIRKGKEYTDADIREFFYPIKDILNNLPDIIRASEVSKKTGLTNTELKNSILGNGFIKYKKMFINGKSEVIYIRKGKEYTDADIREFFYPVKDIFVNLPDVVIASEVSKKTGLKSNSLVVAFSDNHFIKYKVININNTKDVAYIRKGTPAEHFTRQQIREALA